MAQLEIREVLQDPIKCDEIVSILPARFSTAFSSYVYHDVPDRLVWTGDSSATFSTKKFRASISTRYPNNGWGSVIWKKWIPKKISVFAWRLFHNGLPTDDNIRRLCIPMVSRCGCFLKSEETLNHLFFNGGWAIKVWTFMKSIFGIQCPTGINDLVSLWIGLAEPKSFNGAMRTCMSLFALWEIWRARNTLIHEGKQHDVINAVCTWATRVSKLVNLPQVVDSHIGRRLLNIGISCNSRKDGSWKCWKSMGACWTVNIAMINKGGGTRVGLVVRDRDGSFGMAGSLPISHNGLLGLVDSITTVTRICLEQNFCPMIMQCSNIYFGDLFFGKEENLEWEAVYARRRFRRDFGWLNITRVNASQNNAAIALAYHGVGLYFSSHSLPGIVALALREDSNHIQKLSYPFESD